MKRGRRFFLQLTGIGFASIFVFVWNKLTMNHLELKTQVKKTFPFNKQKEVIFQDEFIITNINNITTVFSSKCTHLGCAINKLDNGRLICPCHGSEYNLEGKAIKGPAYKNLKKLSFSVSEDGNYLNINA